MFQNKKPYLFLFFFILGVAPVLFLCSCELRQTMYSNGRIKPLEPNSFFANQSTARSLPEGVIARGHLQENSFLFTGKNNGGLGSGYPFSITKEDLERGRSRFEIYCSVCHGKAGYGDGMVVQRGYKIPPSFHTDRLREIPEGYFFHVITNGFGVMPAYAPMLTVSDRWKIVAYIRALQLSQNTLVSSLSSVQKEALEKASSQKKGDHKKNDQVRH